MSPLADILALARFQAARAVPYLARGLWACTYIESEEVPTFAIDHKWRVLVNPAFARACEQEGSLGAALVHEALHNVLRHGTRARILAGQSLDGDTHDLAWIAWNRAGDCEINYRIDELKGLKLPSCGIHAQDFGWEPGQAAEAYYRESPKKEGRKSGSCAGGSGAGCPHPGEKALPKDGEPGPQGLSEAEGDLVSASVAQAVKDAAASKPESVPKGLLRWAETFGDPPAVDWRQLVQARVRHAVSTRKGPSPSYARQSRRSMGCAMILPVYRQALPQITIVCDTSGSMGDSDIGKSLAAVADACLALGSVKACACDAAAGDVVEVSHPDDSKEVFTGGGGTDMLAGIAAALDGNPDCIVVCTDGETAWPTEAPSVPVVIVLTRNPTYCGRPPAWAEVIPAY